VQFLEVLGPEAIRIEIWERGAGYTLASGTSSCAAAAVAHRLGLCGPTVRVHMPGGALDVTIAPGFRVTLEGPVTRVAEGRLHREMLEQSLPETAVS
jgi:diaminopimelate epimerase